MTTAHRSSVQTCRKCRRPIEADASGATDVLIYRNKQTRRITGFAHRTCPESA